MVISWVGLLVGVNVASTFVVGIFVIVGSSLSATFARSDGALEEALVLREYVG